MVKLMVDNDGDCRVLDVESGKCLKVCSSIREAVKYCHNRYLDIVA